MKRLISIYRDKDGLRFEWGEEPIEMDEVLDALADTLGLAYGYCLVHAEKRLPLEEFMSVIQVRVQNVADHYVAGNVVTEKRDT